MIKKNIFQSISCFSKHIGDSGQFLAAAYKDDSSFPFKSLQNLYVNEILMRLNSVTAFCKTANGLLHCQTQPSESMLI